MAPRKKDKTVTTKSVCLPDDDWNLLKELADLKDQTVSLTIRAMLKEYQILCHLMRQPEFREFKRHFHHLYAENYNDIMAGNPLKNLNVKVPEFKPDAVLYRSGEYVEVAKPDEQEELIDTNK